MNVRRTIAIAVLAGGITCAPAAAFAYVAPSPEPPEDQSRITCSATSVAAGDSFTCTVTSTLGDKAALQTSASTFDAAIAGTVTSGTKALRSGAASFTVSTPSDASGTVTATGIVDGGAVGSVAVDVTNTAVLSEDTGTTATETTSAVLSATGFAGTTMALGAGVLLVAGATTVIVAARRNGPEDAQ